jgi:ribosomal protein S18 acetylase RimI-like enzyme
LSAFFLNMNAEFTIRRCTVEDADALSALAMRTFFDTFTGTCTEEDMNEFLDKYYSIPRIKQELSDPNDLIYFIEKDAVPAGYLRFGENEVPFPYDNSLKALELNRLYIDSPYKGQGVAQQLMAFYEDYAMQNGYLFLWLGVWEHNYRAQAFYKKFSFRFNGHTHPFPIGHTPQTDEWWVKLLP